MPKYQLNTGQDIVAHSTKHRKVIRKRVRPEDASEEALLLRENQIYRDGVNFPWKCGSEGKGN